MRPPFATISRNHTDKRSCKFLACKAPQLKERKKFLQFLETNIDRGISKATGIDLGRLVLMNVAYELEGVCTSIVAQDAQGNLFHARNLDFGLFLGWDQTNKTWKVAEALRPLLFNAHFVRNGTELYKSVAYAGIVYICDFSFFFPFSFCT